MKKLFVRTYVFLTKLILFSVFGYFIFSFFDIGMRDFSFTSVTTINVISGILAVTIGTGLIIAGAMANDSGKGGFFIGLVQFVTLTYPLVYLISLISSISVLYSEMENKQEIAKWLASMSLIQLTFIALLFIVGIQVENYNDRQRKKKWKEFK